MQIVKCKPVQFEALFYDGTLSVHEAAKAWVRHNGGEIYTESDELHGTEEVFLYCRAQGTVDLFSGSWIVRNAQDDFVVYTPEDLNEKFDIL